MLPKLESDLGNTMQTALLQESYSSWLYSVGQGATTIWEHWDGGSQSCYADTYQRMNLDHTQVDGNGRWGHPAIQVMLRDLTGMMQPQSAQTLPFVFRPYIVAVPEIIAALRSDQPLMLQDGVRSDRAQVAEVFLPDGRVHLHVMKAERIALAIGSR